MTRFRVLIADDVDPAAVLKRGWTKVREIVITETAKHTPLQAVEMGLRRTGNLSDAERVVRVWLD